jgi:hypothetical protein
MRTFLKAAAGAAVLSAFIVAAAGCSNGTTGGTTGSYLPQAAVYAGESGSTTYTLIVSDGGEYTLLIKTGGTVTVSTGAVPTDGTYQPDYPGSMSFSITTTTADKGITNITGTITLNTGNTVSAPVTVSPIPPEPGGSIVGTWEPLGNVSWPALTAGYFDGGGISSSNYTYSTSGGNKTWEFTGDFMDAVQAVLKSKNMPYRGEAGENGYDSQPGTVVLVEKDEESFLVCNPGDRYWSQFGNLTTLVFAGNTLSPESYPDDGVYYSLNGTSITMGNDEYGWVTTTAVINGDFLFIGPSTGFNIAGVYERKP